MSAARHHVVIAVRGLADVGTVRRGAVLLASDLGFEETARGRVALVATEAATNIARHAGCGEILVGAAEGEVELLALDAGPGMDDVARCLQDGYSTKGSAGTGLGAIRRLSSAFDLYTRPGRGTALQARIAAGSARAPGGRFEVGAICTPHPLEQVCGDAWAWCETPKGAATVVVDGLGHGPLAAEAAEEAVRVFREDSSDPCERIVERLHVALRGTRGAAVAAAEVRLEERRLRYSGLGNISGGIYVAQKSSGLVSRNGTAGLTSGRIQAFEYDWPEGGQLIMHSDGLGTRWSLEAYPGLATRAPSLIAGVLYRDHARGRDDSSVLVLREARSGTS